jgi:hypothetical protein
MSFAQALLCLGFAGNELQHTIALDPRLEMDDGINQKNAFKKPLHSHHPCL